MLCVNGHENHTGRNFCTTCGSPLSQITSPGAPSPNVDMTSPAASTGTMGRVPWIAGGAVGIVLVVALLVTMGRGGSSSATTIAVITTETPTASMPAPTTSVDMGIRVVNTVSEPATCTDLEENSTPPYIYCDSGPDVLAIQLALETEGYDVNPDGYFGPKTKRAVSRYQKSMGVDVTGQVDADLWGYLVGARFEDQTSCLNLRYYLNESNAPLDNAELMSALTRAMDQLRFEGWTSTADLMASHITQGRYDDAKKGIEYYLESNNCP